MQYKFNFMLQKYFAYNTIYEHKPKIGNHVSVVITSTEVLFSHFSDRFLWSTVVLNPTYGA
jgi:hypothetical protein